MCLLFLMTFLNNIFFGSHHTGLVRTGTMSFPETSSYPGCDYPEPSLLRNKNMALYDLLSPLLAPSSRKTAGALPSIPKRTPGHSHGPAPSVGCSALGLSSLPSHTVCIWGQGGGHATRLDKSQGRLIPASLSGMFIRSIVL